MKKNFFAHKTACIDPGVCIGRGTKIWCFSHILKGARIGNNCNIGQNVVVHPTAVVGNGVKIQNNVSIYDAVILEDDVFCGPACVFTNIINPRSGVPRNSAKFYKKTLVRRGATIGANATVLCGIEIGRYAFVGAGAVVTKSLPAYALAYGNPARIKGWACECGTPLKFRKASARCADCRTIYQKTKNTIHKI
ncbi:MAG: hypothetical protein A2787_05010 [Omnitrophica WOR_2 bacterium RIFCSPHIGHO2_01_FULL_48_9]|nr:MAG: hypothetical protein A3D10_02360 [Omnitrophica WOR_2 bacterium RIFCSPHIGHO2_02_FULL_48_11]OGX30583.1 MAG: hypothetical protein A2787_05010 [Omnitrophica WOR_2 bacterium RIFCSPHIGHO2_01_FULL_48_9]